MLALCTLSCCCFKCFRTSHACHMCSVVFLPVYNLFKIFQKISCLPYVFNSVLACAKPAHAHVSNFQKHSYLLCRLCFSLSSLLLPQTVRLYNIAFSGFPTAVHRAFLFFDAKAWPQSQTDLFTFTTVLHCGYTFLRRIDLMYGITLWAYLS